MDTQSLSRLLVFVVGCLCGLNVLEDAVSEPVRAPALLLSLAATVLMALTLALMHGAHWGHDESRFTMTFAIILTGGRAVAIDDIGSAALCFLMAGFMLFRALAAKLRPSDEKPDVDEEESKK